MNPQTSSQEAQRVFGKWVADHRNRMGLTQQELAERARITRQQVNRIERGVSGTERDTVIRIAQAVDGDLNTALELAGFKALSGTDPELLLARRLNVILRHVPRHKRSQLEEMLEQMARILVANAA